MTEKVYVVTDLGPGDGGKGGVVHKVGEIADAHTVVKVGGGQGNHGVRTSDGQRFAFSHWGCRTLEGTPTHNSKNFVIIPEGILNEADALRFTCGIQDPFRLLTVDERALCATHYHGIASHLKELARRDRPRGTVGTGVGEAVRHAAHSPDLAIYARDLTQPYLRDLLAAVRQAIRFDLEPIIREEFLPADRGAMEREVALLRDDAFFDFVVKRFEEVRRRVRIVDEGYLEREILAQDGHVVVESSHGILTDRFHGFHPHTSAIRTLPRFTQAMFAEAGYRGKIVNIGVTRAYQIRHGAGPMPTADPAMATQLLPGSQKEDNRWQGSIRVGPLDLVLLRYAIAVCGGPSAFDGLAVTWFDQIQANEKWHLCHRYSNATHPTYFDPVGALNVRRGEDEAQLQFQEELGRQLLHCMPEIETIRIPKDADRDTAYDLCAEIVNQSLNVPVVMVSFGPTERDTVAKKPPTRTEP